MKLYTKNFIKDEKELNKLSRSSLLKIINMVPMYLNKSILEIIDNEIKTYTNDNLITISNNRINDLRSDISKKKYKSIFIKENYSIYEYSQHIDIYISLLIIDVEKSIKNILEEEIIKNYEILHITSKSIKKPFIFTFEKNENINDKLEKIYKKVIKLKKNDEIKFRFFASINEAPILDKEEIKKKKK